MSVSRKTQKDIGNYEAKFLGPFTTRQAALLGIGMVPTALGYIIIYGITGDKFIGAAALVLIIPFAFLAFGQALCYGMKPEDFLVEYYLYHIKAPAKRKYITVTVDDVLENERIKKLKKEAEAESKGKKKKKKNEESIEIRKEGEFKKYPHKPDPEFVEFE